jgi:Na+:H+ antiporter, NhaA family
MSDESPRQSDARHAPVRNRTVRRGWRATFPRLSSFALENLLLLPLGVLIALVWANTGPESYYSVAYAMSFAVNDVSMVFFFALMTKEVVEATAPGGVLHPWRRAWLPVAAAIGATAIPALIYSQAVDALDEPVLAVAWPVPFATDIAASYFLARIIFRQHPVIPFLLLLGIASDALGFMALAVAQTSRDFHFVQGASIMVVAIGMAYVFRRARVRSFWPYLVVAGGLSWVAFFRSGLHPALALIPIMPFLPHAARDPGFFVDAAPEAKDTLSRFELTWRYPAQIALFLFGLVNAGVSFHALELGTWGVPIAVLAGKPLGILAATGIALAAGLHLPHRVGWRELMVVGFAAAIGLSVGLFFCAAILPPGQLRSETSMGVLLSLMGAPLALGCAWLLHVGRFAR